MLALDSDSPTLECSPESLPNATAEPSCSAEELELLQLSGNVGEAELAKSWWTSFGSAVCLHVVAFAGCWWGLGAFDIERIIVSGSQVVLSAQFSDSVPHPQQAMEPIEIELNPKDFAEATKPVDDPPPLTDFDLQLPAAEVCPEPLQHELVELTSPPTETAAESTPVTVGLTPLKPAECLRNDPPEYPSEAVTQGWSGRVLLRLHISNAGDVADIDLVESSGHKLLDDAALVAVKKWEFHPAQSRVGPIESTALLPIRFGQR